MNARADDVAFADDAKRGQSLRAARGSVSGRTHLDLFSGIGGFALAAQRAGWKTIGFAETDEYASKVLRKHWPGVPNYGDVRNVRNIRADLITGGFPCQPFSQLGARRGDADARYLWPEMCRIISESRPTWVCGENVPNLDGMALGNVLADMETLGYEVQTLEIPACGVGAPHIRKRLWILAHSNGGRLKQKLPVSEGEGARMETETQRTGESRLSDAWASEPAVGRVADGIPARVDRLRGLGNAIVPQIATVILAAMARTQNAEVSDDARHGVESPNSERGGVREH